MVTVIGSLEWYILLLGEQFSVDDSAVEQSCDSSKEVSAREETSSSLSWAGPSSGDALILEGACCLFSSPSVLHLRSVSPPI